MATQIKFIGRQVMVYVSHKRHVFDVAELTDVGSVESIAARRVLGREWSRTERDRINTLAKTLSSPPSQKSRINKGRKVVHNRRRASTETKEIKQDVLEKEEQDEDDEGDERCKEKRKEEEEEGDDEREKEEEEEELSDSKLLRVRPDASVILRTTKIGAVRGLMSFRVLSNGAVRFFLLGERHELTHCFNSGYTSIVDFIQHLIRGSSSSIAFGKKTPVQTDVFLELSQPPPHTTDEKQKEERWGLDFKGDGNLGNAATELLACLQPTRRHECVFKNVRAHSIDLRAYYGADIAALTSLATYFLKLGIDTTLHEPEPLRRNVSEVAPTMSSGEYKTLVRLIHHFSAFLDEIGHDHHSIYTEILARDTLAMARIEKQLKHVPIRTRSVLRRELNAPPLNDVDVRHMVEFVDIVLGEKKEDAKKKKTETEEVWERPPTFVEMVTSTILSREKLPLRLREMSEVGRWALRAYKKQVKASGKKGDEWSWKKGRRYAFVNYESHITTVLAAHARGIQAVVKLENRVINTMDLYALSRSLRRDWIHSPTRNIFFTGDYHARVYERVLLSAGYTIIQSITDDTGCLNLSGLRQPWTL